jgi:hypothetical protein
MLAISLAEDHLWWVQGGLFERLVDAALADGAPAELDTWRNVACANGGLDLTRMRPEQAQWLRTVLRTAAQREIARLGEPDPSTRDGGYVVALRRLLSPTVE